MALMRDGRQIHLANVEQQLAAGDARDVEQVLDQPRLRVRIAIDALERVLDFLGGQLAAAQQVDPADDRVERRAQLVRQRGEELVLQAIGLLLAIEQLGALALRGLDFVEHAVERLHQHADLVAGRARAARIE